MNERLAKQRRENYIRQQLETFSKSYLSVGRGFCFDLFLFKKYGFSGVLI